jgi:hypothetical protein
MAKKLLIVTDLGRFKAYRFEESPLYSTPRLELLEDRDTKVNERMSEQVTDQAGQFSKGARSFAAVNDMSNGERHNLALEIRRRAVKELADLISQILKQENVDGCYLAAGSEINQTLLDALPPHVRARIEKNVTANLTRLNAAQIIEHFCTPK